MLNYWGPSNLLSSISFRILGCWPNTLKVYPMRWSPSLAMIQSRFTQTHELEASGTNFRYAPCKPELRLNHGYPRLLLAVLGIRSVMRRWTSSEEIEWWDLLTLIAFVGIRSSFSELWIYFEALREEDNVCTERERERKG